MPKTPKTSSTLEIPRKQAKSLPLTFQDQQVCWQIGQFDFESRWGLEAALGNVAFSLSDDLLTSLCTCEANELCEALEKLSGKPLLSFSHFYKKLKELFPGPIPSEIVHQISVNLSRRFFADKIYPKLRDFETKTWKEVERETTGNDASSKHHAITLDKLSKEARDRLTALKLNDLDSLFSLRLDGTLRIFGIRNQNYLRILWVDQDHEICPSFKKNT